MITAIIFIIVLSVIVFVHELGHFIMAKRAGMKVEEFGFGFPPRLCGYKPKNSETTYTINAIPFGGFVKIQGEDGDDRTNQRSFSTKSFWGRTSVILAGVVMNVILAAVLLAIINMRGADSKIVIREIAPKSPASEAGMRKYDELLGFENIAVAQKFIIDHKGESITVSVKRTKYFVRKEVHQLTMTPRLNPPPGEGAVGISFGELEKIQKYPWHEALWRGGVDAVKGTWAMAAGFAGLLKHLFTTGKAGVEIAGPVGIAIFAGEAARLGLIYLLQFMAFISLNLAVINVVPFPALDGGRFLFLIIEKIKGSPLPRRIENGFNTVGFVLLLLLMFFITAKDVLKFL